MSFIREVFLAKPFSTGKILPGTDLKVLKACGVGETLQVWVKQGDGETLQDKINNNNRENLKAIENRLLIKIFEK